MNKEVNPNIASAAPELYSALKDLVDSILSQPFVFPMMFTLHREFENARKALDKADGK